jgi:hypothetical protein
MKVYHIPDNLPNAETLIYSGPLTGNIGPGNDSAAPAAGISADSHAARVGAVLGRLWAATARPFYRSIHALFKRWLNKSMINTNGELPVHRAH